MITAINKNIFVIVTYVLFMLMALLAFSIFEVKVEEAFAWTYYGTWWLGGDVESESPANARIIYTYPDVVQAGEPFNVGVTLEYLKDKPSRSNWIVFSNVSVSMRSLPVLPGEPNLLDLLTSTEHKTSGLIRAGEKFSNSFNLTAPKNASKYMIALTFNAFFGPGSGGVGTFQFDTGAYYNQTNREHGIILPVGLQGSPPISVEDKISRQQLLNIEIESPFSEIRPINITVDDQDYPTINKRRLQLPSDSFPIIKVPEEIYLPGDDMGQNLVRAVFTKWSDGNENNPRKITTNRNVELFALYKTQYKLNAFSSGEIKIDNTPYQRNYNGWFDSVSEIQYSVNPLAGFWNLPPQSFDRWVGVDQADDDKAVGRLIMDGPKNISAKWKDDYTYLAIIIGVIVGIVTASIEVVINRQKIGEFVDNTLSKIKLSKTNKKEESK